MKRYLKSFAIPSADREGSHVKQVKNHQRCQVCPSCGTTPIPDQCSAANQRALPQAWAQKRRHAAAKAAAMKSEREGLVEVPRPCLDPR